MPTRPAYRYDDPRHRVIASWTDPVARAATTLLGGPWGRHAEPGRQRWWTPMRVLFAMATVTLALAWFKQAPCAYNPWQDGSQYTGMCYADSIPLWGIEGISEGAVPYFDMNPILLPGDPNYSFGRVEYPVLTGFFMYVADKLQAPADAIISAGLAEGESVNGWAAYYATTCVLLALCFYALVYFSARTAGRRIWDVAIIAAAPIVVVYGFTNWDLFAMMFLAAAMFAWSRQLPLLCGVLLGLGTAAKLYPVLMLGALLVLAVRTGRFRGFALATVGTVGAWLAVNLPVMLGAWAGWKVFLDLNRERPADYASLWNVIERLASDQQQFEFTSGLSTGVLNLLVFVAMALACVAIAWLALAAPVRPRVAQLVFLIVAAFLLTNKVWSAQYSIWLLPLAVLALPRWRLIVAWQLVEGAVWVCSSLWFLQRDISFANERSELSGDDPKLLSGVDYEWVALFVLIRCALIIAMMAFVVRDILRPQYDAVRRVGQDDPSGGEFDTAPDRFTLRRGRDRELDPDPQPIA